MTEELKTCPFCNGLPQKREVNHWTGMRNDLLRVEFIHHCEGLKPRQRATLNVSAVTEEEAIEAWNRRATPAPAQPEGQDDESLEWKFSCVIDHATGGKLSKPGWALATIKSAIDEHVNETHKSWDEDEAGAAAPAEGAAWQPIEAAPKDGREVWAFNGEQARMQWLEQGRHSCWIWADLLLSEADPSPDQPTHWMPLPAAPKEKP